MVGADPLIEQVRPTATRAVTLPDGDFEYAISVNGSHLNIDEDGTNEWDTSGRWRIGAVYPDEVHICLGDESDHEVWSLEPEPAEQTVSLPDGTKLGGMCGVWH